MMSDDDSENMSERTHVRWTCVLIAIFELVAEWDDSRKKKREEGKVALRLSISHDLTKSCICRILSLF